jgi:hypothetical protein
VAGFALALISGRVGMMFDFGGNCCGFKIATFAGGGGGDETGFENEATGRRGKKLASANAAISSTKITDRFKQNSTPEVIQARGQYPTMSNPLSK